MISPSEVAPVCSAGQQLVLTCNTTERFLRWSFSLLNEEGNIMIYTRAVTSIDGSQQVSHIIVNSTSFMFSRTSSQGMLPLISKLLINPLSNGLNGTKVNCTGVSDTVNDETSTSTTTIHIIRDSYAGISLLLILYLTIIISLCMHTHSK